MHDAVPAYGLWSLVIINSAVFIFFAFSFIKPKTKLDWRSLGAFSAFIVALFAEMYGFPLSIYLLSGWLQSKFPGTDIFSHDNGHLWYTLFGFKGNPHLNPIHLISNLLIFAGFYITYRAWRVLHAAQQEGVLATTGPAICQGSSPPVQRLPSRNDGISPHLAYYPDTCHVPDHGLGIYSIG